MKIFIKDLFNFILAFVTMGLAGSCYLIQHYLKHRHSFNAEAKAFGKSRGWVIFQHINVISSIITLILVNLVGWCLLLLGLYNWFIV